MNLSDLIGFFPKQLEATQIADTHKYTLYGGSRGPGKSYWLRWYLVYRLLKWAAEGYTGVEVALCCETYRTLYDRHLKKIQSDLPAWLGSYYPSKHEFVLDAAYGGGMISFRNLDEPGKYDGVEWAGIAVDEVVKNSYRTFTSLRGSNRWPRIEDTFMIFASNPSSNWVRDLWVAKDFSDYPELVTPYDYRANFAFVRALPGDNPLLSDEYYRDLETQPEAIKKAWLYGDWFAAMEGIVYSEFTDENIEEYIPDPDKTVEIGFDDGYIDPCAVLFIQRTGNHVYVFDELYLKKHTDVQITSAIIDRMGYWFGWQDANKTIPHKMPEIAIGSHEAAKLHREMKNADILSRHKLHKVVDGIKHVRQLFCDGQGYRALIIDPRCKHLINELTTGYRYHDDGRKRSDEEKPQDGNDHACDALRYWCWTRVRR